MASTTHAPRIEPNTSPLAISATLINRYMEGHWGSAAGTTTSGRRGRVTRPPETGLQCGVAYATPLAVREPAGGNLQAAHRREVSGRV